MLRSSNSILKSIKLYFGLFEKKVLKNLLSTICFSCRIAEVYFSSLSKLSLLFCDELLERHYVGVFVLLSTKSSEFFYLLVRSDNFVCLAKLKKLHQFTLMRFSWGKINFRVVIYLQPIESQRCKKQKGDAMLSYFKFIHFV